MRVTWIDNHKSDYSFDFLKKWEYISKPTPKTEWKHLEKLQFVDFESFGSEESIWKWLQILNQDGVSIVKNVPLESGSVEKVANYISFIKETVYGRIFDVVSMPNATNIAYTSLELKPHMDLMYYEGSPGFQLLHCIKANAKGGESTFVDAFAAAQEFRKQDPSGFDLLSKIKLTFHKNDDTRNYYHRKPLFVVENKELVAVNYSPMFEGPLIASENMIAPLYSAYKRFQTMIDHGKYTKTYLLKPGECAIFNNRRVLHGRLQFDENSGERHLQGTYLDHEEFCNRYLGLQRKFGGPGLLPIGSFCQYKK